MSTWDEIIQNACDTLGIPNDERVKAWGEQARRDLLEYLEAPIEGPEHDAALAKFQKSRAASSFLGPEGITPCQEVAAAAAGGETP